MSILILALCVFYCIIACSGSWCMCVVALSNCWFMRCSMPPDAYCIAKRIRPCEVTVLFLTQYQYWYVFFCFSGATIQQPKSTEQK